MLHLLAGHAPVGIEVEHHATPLAARQRHLALEVGHALDALELQPGGRQRAGLHRAALGETDPAQRLEHVAPTAGGTDQQHRTVEQHHQAGALPEATPAAAFRWHAVERAEVDRRDDQQRGPHRHGQRGRQDALEHPDRDADQQHAEHRLDGVHPRACLRQQLAGRGADQQQRRAHAQAKREQRRAAEHCVAGLPDVDQRACQRRGDARADDQCRQEPHDRHAGQRAALLAVARGVDAALSPVRHLQVVEAEHR